MTYQQHDPFATPPPQPGKGLSRTAALAVGAVIAFVVGGIGLGAWLLFSNVGGDDTYELDVFSGYTPKPVDLVSNKRPDFTRFDAVPGESFVQQSGGMRVGVDIPSGVYRADIEVIDDLDHWDALGQRRCEWTVQSERTYTVDTFIADGFATEAGGVAVLPEGYFVGTRGCGTWEAIDPQELWSGATETVIGEGTHYVGRDLVAGTYVLPRSVGEEHEYCFVTISHKLGFTGPNMWQAILQPGSYPAVLHLEEGLTLKASGCPPLPMVDTREVFAQGLGAPEFSDGGWVVGIDVLPGTYVTNAELVDPSDFCMISGWNEGALQDVYWTGHGMPSEQEKNIREVQHPGDPATEVTLEAGQTVHSYECGTVTRVSD